METYWQDVVCCFASDEDEFMDAVKKNFHEFNFINLLDIQLSKTLHP